MTTSFPFLKIARDYDVPYGLIIRIAAVYDGDYEDGRESTLPEMLLELSDRATMAEGERVRKIIMAILNACYDEKERRGLV